MIKVEKKFLNQNEPLLMQEWKSVYIKCYKNL
jgi:hypothetical protein